jgi:uncharacterized protein (TIRG00374 family)
MARSRSTKLAGFFVRLGVLVALTYLIVAHIDFPRLREAIAIREYGYLALAFAGMMAVPPVMALRLSYALGRRVPGLTAGLYKSYFFNNFLPAQLGGDVYKVYLLRKRIGAGRGEAVAAVFGDRMIGVTGLLVISLACVALGRQYFANDGVWYALAVYLAIVLAFYIAVLAMPILLSWNRLQSGRLARYTAGIRASQQRVTRILRSKLPVGILLTAVAYGMLIVTNVMVMFALDMRIDVWASMLYIPVISMAVLTLPISFNGLGVRESLFVLFFGMAGYSHEQSLALALINLVALLAVAGVGGLLLLISRERASVIVAEEKGRQVSPDA